MCFQRVVKNNPAPDNRLRRVPCVVAFRLYRCHPQVVLPNRPSHLTALRVTTLSWVWVNEESDYGSIGVEEITSAASNPRWPPISCVVENDP